MLCWNCGNELTEGTDFCSLCGVPTADNTDIVKEPPEELETDNAEPPLKADSVADNLILRKNHVYLSGEKLYLTGKYYKKQGSRFKQKRGNMEVPLSSVSDTAILQDSYKGKRIASFLLAVIFACGTLTSGYLGVKSFISLTTPYRQEQERQLADTLKRLEYYKDMALQDLELTLNDIQEETGLLELLLDEYQNRRGKELLSGAAGNLDLEQIFSDDFFTDAFEQYLTDLLDAFKNDVKLNEWLYPYYTFTMEIGENPYINKNKNLDMWFYEMPGNSSKFTSDVKDGAAFLSNVNELRLYDLIYYYGRIYLSASDLMNLILKMPNYVADSAVFVRAYGGNPAPDRMSVPGWNSSDYISFWHDAEKYITRDYPIWTYYNLSAQDFSLEWNDLTDEQMYYNAYVKFMDTIAPGLSVFDKVFYYGSDDAYGGMGFDITSKEAAPTEIALLFLENHPESIDLFVLDIPTSYDDRIADTQKQLDELRLKEEKLTAEKNTLSDHIAEGASLYDEYEALLDDIRAHRTGLIKKVLLFSIIAGFLCLMTLFNIYLFIRLLEKPGCLMVLKLSDSDTIGFSAAFCSKQKLTEFQDRFSGQQSVLQKPETD